MLTTSPYPPYRILDIIDDANNLTMTSPQSQAFWRRLRGCRLLRGLQVDCKRVPECKLQAVHEWLTRTSLLSYSMNTGHRTKLNNSPFCLYHFLYWTAYIKKSCYKTALFLPITHLFRRKATLLRSSVIRRHFFECLHYSISFQRSASDWIPMLKDHIFSNPW